MSGVQMNQRVERAGHARGGSGRGPGSEGRWLRWGRMVAGRGP